jgi:hypothetical protein
MRRRGTLLHCDEAMRVIDQIEDPVTRNLVNMIFVHMVKTTHLENQEHPDTDFDMLYFIKVMKEFFSEHQVLTQALAGEKVGAWFDEDE